MWCSSQQAWTYTTLLLVNTHICTHSCILDMIGISFHMTENYTWLFLHVTGIGISWLVLSYISFTQAVSDRFYLTFADPRSVLSDFVGHVKCPGTKKRPVTWWRRHGAAAVQTANTVHMVCIMVHRNNLTYLVLRPTAVALCPHSLL